MVTRICRINKDSAAFSLKNGEPFHKKLPLNKFLTNYSNFLFFTCAQGKRIAGVNFIPDY